ncbi:NUDIX hydrolase [Austwickia chelonae]|uniref:NUDIX hydrolase n=1 Tax=Austwickia chelonae TaxID=100225 RepID=UPI000E2558DE|nr:NUDIX domain-containing protein [Austwickia chelonae]
MNGGRRYPLPGDRTAQVRAWQESGATAVGPRDAATVVLLRDRTRGHDAQPDRTSGGLEVFVLRRAATMLFAPSTYVFPGGGVDPTDYQRPSAWHGPDPRAWARVLDLPDPELAGALVVAAARELFEECGVLLAGPDPDHVVADLDTPHWSAARKALVVHRLTFADLLAENGLVLRADLLRAVDHWITPEFESRRYSTRFFAAVLPTGQQPDGDCTEADDARWVRPADLLAEVHVGQALILPPTRSRLDALLDGPARTAAEWWHHQDPAAVVPALLAVPVRTADRYEIVAQRVTSGRADPTHPQNGRTP